MKKNISYTIITCLTFWLTACEQHDVEKYQNDPRLYFYYGTADGGKFTQGDSMIYSFFVLPDEQDLDTVYVDIRAMGFPTDAPRPINIMQSNAGSPDAAIPGKHFLAFDSEEMKNTMAMPAKAVRYLWPIVLKRDPSLETSSVRLELRIGENEYFKTGIDTLLKYTIIITARAEKPALWNSYWQYTFGDFGSRKLWFLINYVGLTNFNEYIYDSGLQSYYQAKAILELEKYNANENNPDRPLREADGTLVTFN